MPEFAWLLITAALVFTMQAGFLCLESGRIRSKNSYYFSHYFLAFWLRPHVWSFCIWDHWYQRICVWKP